MKHCERIILALPLVLAVACGPSGDDDVVECEAALLPGDLVFTEIQANPEGEDEGNEWLEIYNASSQTLNLTGMVLIASKEDESSPKTHVMTELVIESGDYLVLGGVLPEFKPAFVDYGYADDLGSLLNTAGRLVMECGDVEVDEVIYGEATSGKSQQFTGTMAPDYTSNDVITNWCDATDANEYLTNNYGTPGAANQDCIIINPDSCNDGGVDRDLVPPTAGDLVITEYMPSPDTIADGDGEWFEVLATADVDLNGLQLGRAEIATGPGSVALTLESPDCLEVTAGTYILFARNANPAENGGLPGTPFEFGFSLVGTDDGVFIAHDDVVLDVVTYAAAANGVSTSLDPDHLNPTDNDNADYWCPGRTAYHVDNMGTPGLANQECIGAGECDDEGTIRAIVSPIPADVTITEILSNPSGTDGSLEWVEVHFAAAVDLNGVTLGRTSTSTSDSTTFDAVDCLEVTAGEYVVFAGALDAASNGGLPKADFLLDISLNNTDTSVHLEVDSTELDLAAYTTDLVGYSRAKNGLDGAWCEAADADVYGTNDPEDHGTPGAANVAVQNCP